MASSRFAADLRWARMWIGRTARTVRLAAPKTLVKGARAGESPMKRTAQACRLRCPNDRALLITSVVSWYAFSAPPVENLPLASDLIAVSSKEGRQLLAASQVKTDYSQLAPYLRPQDRRAFCGPATGAAVINAALGPKPRSLSRHYSTPRQVPSRANWPCRLLGSPWRNSRNPPCAWAAGQNRLRRSIGHRRLSQGRTVYPLRICYLPC